MLWFLHDQRSNNKLGFKLDFHFLPHVIRSRS
jgi:hypothetical protein